MRISASHLHREKAAHRRLSSFTACSGAFQTTDASSDVEKFVFWTFLEFVSGVLGLAHVARLEEH